MIKVLVISHNPLCTYNGMGKTLASLLSSFRIEELCQIYIYPSFPDVDLCTSYFRITDKEVLRSLYSRSQPGAELDKGIINPDQPPFETARDEAVYRNARNKTAIRQIGRDLIWKFSTWYGARLHAWLERESPSCILVAPGPACFLYDFAMRIAEDRGIPIASYICDEYYFVQPRKDAAEKLHQKWLGSRMEKLMARTSALVVISEELRTAYQQRFHVPTHVLMTGKSMDDPAGNMADKPASFLSYFGNIRCGRYLSLARIGEELDQLNRESGKQFKLHVYTKENDQSILDCLSGFDSIVLHDFVQGEAFTKAFFSSELLVHVESFQDEMVDRVKHSVSTKVADSLASGIPLLAFGPAGISSMEHLRRNGCAFVCTEPEELRNVLIQAMSDTQARERIVERAFETAERFHNEEKNSRELYQILSQIGGEQR